MQFDVDAGIGWLLGQLYTPGVACYKFRVTTPIQDRHVNFYDVQMSLKLNQFQGSSCIMVSPRISDISLLLGVLGAISTVKFRPLEPSLLTVSVARHFEDPNESDPDDDSAEVT